MAGTPPRRPDVGPATRRCRRESVPSALEERVHEPICTSPQSGRWRRDPEGKFSIVVSVQTYFHPDFRATEQTNVRRHVRESGRSRSPSRLCDMCRSPVTGSPNRNMVRLLRPPSLWSCRSASRQRALPHCRYPAGGVCGFGRFCGEMLRCGVTQGVCGVGPAIGCERRPATIVTPPGGDSSGRGEDRRRVASLSTWTKMPTETSATWPVAKDGGSFILNASAAVDMKHHRLYREVRAPRQCHLQ